MNAYNLFKYRKSFQNSDGENTSECKTPSKFSIIERAIYKPAMCNSSEVQSTKVCKSQIPRYKETSPITYPPSLTPAKNVQKECCDSTTDIFPDFSVKEEKSISEYCKEVVDVIDLTNDSPCKEYAGKTKQIALVEKASSVENVVYVSDSETELERVRSNSIKAKLSNADSFVKQKTNLLSGSSSVSSESSTNFEESVKRRMEREQKTPERILSKETFSPLKFEAPLSPESAKTEFYSYLKITKPLAKSDLLTKDQKRRSARFKNMQKIKEANIAKKLQEEKRKNFKDKSTNKVVMAKPVANGDLTDFDDAINDFFKNEEINPSMKRKAPEQEKVFKKSLTTHSSNINCENAKIINANTEVQKQSEKKKMIKKRILNQKPNKKVKSVFDYVENSKRFTRSFKSKRPTLNSSGVRKIHLATEKKKPKVKPQVQEKTKSDEGSSDDETSSDSSGSSTSDQSDDDDESSNDFPGFASESIREREHCAVIDSLRLLTNFESLPLIEIERIPETPIVVHSETITNDTPPLVPFSADAKTIMPFHRSLTVTLHRISLSKFGVDQEEPLAEAPVAPAIVGAKKSSPKKTHEITIEDTHGPVFSAHYLDHSLVLVQECLVSFWKQSALGNVLGAQNMWIHHGGVHRLALERGCLNRKSSGMCLIARDNQSVGYIELWIKEHKSEKRESPVADVFAVVYFFTAGHGPPDKKVLQLENIKSFAEGVQYVVMERSRQMVVSWLDAFSKPQTVLHAYKFAQDFQTIDSLRELSSTPQLVHSLHNILDCENLLLGYCSEGITVWNLEEGYIVATITLNDLTLEIYDRKCLWARCDKGFLFLVQIISDDTLQLIAINGINKDWKQLQCYKIPTCYGSLRGVACESGILMGCFSNGFICWDALSGAILAETEVHQSQTILPSYLHVVTIEDRKVTVQHVITYLLKND